MAKKHWKEAPLWIQNQVATTRARGGILNLAGHPNKSDATAWLEAAELAMRHGFLYDEPERRAHAEIAEVEKTNPIAVGAARARLSLELNQEDRNAHRWAGMLEWAKQPNAFEVAAQACAEREAKAREEATERR